MALVIQRRQPDPALQLDDTLNPLLRRVLSQRQLTSADDLDLSVSNLLAPETLLGIDAATTLLLDQLQRQGRILIVSDFDADGATSCALGLRALRSLGFESVDFIVPNRFEFGYGLTPEIVELAATRAPDVIITVDNGISSLEGVRAAREKGIKVLVTDHHLPGAELPPADAIVNPNQPGCGFASKSLAGVGVIFYLMLALRARLRELGWFARPGQVEPNLAELLDLVALGTVADVVPLDRNNRILVSEGLRRIRAGRACPGIKALLQIGKRQAPRVTAADLGFVVGPRLNAAGRLDDMALGIDCLLTDSPDQAYAKALELDGLNLDRRLIEGEMQQQALTSLEAVNLDEAAMPAGLCLYDAAWHQGVIGILASRIKERYHRPVIAFADAGEGEDGRPLLKGSARSIRGFHIRDALDAIASSNPGLLDKFGGHAMAAGLSLDSASLPAFREAFAAYAGRLLGEEELQARILSDGEVSTDEFRLENAQALLDAGPWGQGFPEPLFDGLFEVLESRVVGEKHLKLVLSPESTRWGVDAIAFNADLALDTAPGRRLRAVYRLDVNEYRGTQSVQLVVEHLEPA